jgi:hypothetical protein
MAVGLFPFLQVVTDTVPYLFAGPGPESGPQQLPEPSRRGLSRSPGQWSRYYRLANRSGNLAMMLLLPSAEMGLAPR